MALCFHQSNVQSCVQGCCLMLWRWGERWGMSQEKMVFGDKLHRLAQSGVQSWERLVSAGLKWSEVTCPKVTREARGRSRSLALPGLPMEAFHCRDFSSRTWLRFLCSGAFNPYRVAVLAMHWEIHWISLLLLRDFELGGTSHCLGALLAMLSIRNGHWITQHVLCAAGRDSWVAFSRGRGVWSS